MQVLVAFDLGINWPQREAENLLPTSATVKNKGLCTLIVRYIFTS